MKYDKRGVSASKTDVHAAISNLDKGLYSDCFCKVLPDYLTDDPDYGILMHADTAGTKTSLAYIYWKETGDLSVWKGIIQDAIVMNIDDLACAGAFDRIIISSTIGRNRKVISGDVIKEIIDGTVTFIEKMSKLGISIHLSGGETADVGDIVRTIDTGITAVCRMKRKDIQRISIQPGDLIVGLESTGKATYEDEYNSGIGSNGLTFARHEVLSKYYEKKYPESFDENLDRDVVYTGKMKVTDPSAIKDLTAGKLMLSPTRTYLPVLREIFKSAGKEIHGIIHCTGGGQTKVLHFIDGLRIVKDNLFELPEVFRLIQSQNNSDWKEMYQVFNMGHRMEVYLPEKLAKQIISISEKFGIRAKVVGYVEQNKSTEVLIRNHSGEFRYSNR